LNLVFTQLAVEGARFSVLAMAVALTLCLSRHIDLTLGVPALIGAYMAAGAAGTLSWQRMMAGAVLMGLTGLLVGASLFRKDGSERFSGTARILLSLAFLILFENVISLVVGDEPLVGDGVVQLSGTIFGIAMRRVIVAALALVAAAATLAIVRFSSVGRNLRALRTDSELALIAGLPVRRTAMIFFGAAFLLAALGGVLTYLDTAVTPGFAFPYLLMAIAAAVVGGSSSIFGAIGGALVVSALRTFAIWHFGAEWSDSAAFFFLVVVAIVARQHVRVAQLASRFYGRLRTGGQES